MFSLYFSRLIRYYTDFIYKLLNLTKAAAYCLYKGLINNASQMCG
jgi:hypothetical protein